MSVESDTKELLQMLEEKMDKIEKKLNENGEIMKSILANYDKDSKRLYNIENQLDNILEDIEATEYAKTVEVPNREEAIPFEELVRQLGLEEALSDEAKKRTQDKWERICKAIQLQMSDISFRTWIDPLEPLIADESLIALEAPNQFVEKIVKDRYIDVIKKAANGVLGVMPDIRVFADWDRE
jgi:hypothetical protein